ncbi:bifunctional phosphoribosylaminoimidazolecarboxamide formyltransferase/IMP cyclohydrolase [Nitrosomonas communis]|uniref:bifunctional phosphoribosylaminoimidazolecarboxamide formyltransferase/IMP cyclohydrolase n=1 Tax=Nitrosomonas communis TaxID=44574 RepID=UPI0026F37783|nr:bifunctional phosphoribosylaminoimidazolecarboxamide formyltransferase/IMP cyclohydrolase [Nitrosomonas communis]MCO6428764.1 bifunctional phosphoribosylaminoimidazolecarboxamide formyltransferase/IMP cyclohydrolase [Nitrosomonas communis]
MTIKQALISVSNKTGIVELAGKLHQFGINIISSGGTAKLLQQAGIAVTEVSEYTNFPEMLDGRVKTLHPKIHAGILSRMDLPEHQHAIQKAGIPPIELVIVNLYPFVETIAQADCTLEQAIENIDIGGPALIRAAAKNYQHVTVITDPDDYPVLLAEMESSNGATGLTRRFQFAQKAFSHTARYDSAISNYLTAIDSSNQRQTFPDCLNLNFSKIQSLRYGENPHQQAAFYRDVINLPGSLANYAQLQGKELSYNNIADTDAAWECVKSFDSPACVIVKHANPCGVAIADTPLAAYKRAFATDPTSAFGGIIAFNRPIDPDLAKAILTQFVEVIIAPEVLPDASNILQQKANIRVLTVPLQTQANRYDLKRVGGGLLTQTPDDLNITANQLQVVTQAQPTPQQIEDCLFAWRVAKFVKSNAIVFCAQGQALGIGAGQMSRIDSARIASIKASEAQLNLIGSVVASDAFFPFRDGLDVVVQAGARVVIQPGGSIRDEEVIKAADEHGVVMIFTGVRHFRH